jgi:enamine deaminase RidA (YjgF/YER057c/UK114 family)
MRSGLRQYRRGARRRRRRLGQVAQFTTYLVRASDVAGFTGWREREFPQMFPDGAYPPNTLLIVDRLAQEAFLIEVQAIAAK